MKIALLGDSIFNLHFLYFYCTSKLQKNQDIQFDVFLYENDTHSSIYTLQENKFTFDLAEPYIYTYKEFFQNITAKIGLHQNSMYQNQQKFPKYILKEKLFLKAPKNIHHATSHKALWLLEKIKLYNNIKKNISTLSKDTVFQLYKNIAGLNYAEYYSSIYTRENFYLESDDCNFSLAFQNIFSLMQKGNSFYNAVEKQKKEEIQFLDIQPKKNNIATMQKQYINFQNGLEEYKNTLLQYLKKEYKDYIHFKKENITSILYKNKKYSVYSKQNKNTNYTHLFCTLHPKWNKNIFREMDKSIANTIHQIQSKKIIIAFLIWKKKDFQQKGYGISIPNKEKQSFFNSIFLSNIFPQLYPKEYFVVRTHIPEDDGLFTEEEIANLLLENYQRIVHIPNKPLYHKIYRYSIPIYNYNHKESIQELQKLSQPYSNLFFNGKYYNQFSIADSIHSAYKIVKQYEPTL